MKKIEPLAWGAYPVACLLVITPFVDAIARSWPVRLGEIGWRFGALGIGFNTLVTPLLGFLLVLVAAAVLEHRHVARSIAGLMFVVSAVLVVLLGLFVLDYLQVRSTVTAERLASVDMAARKALIMGTLGAGAALAVAVAGWKAGARLSAARARESRPQGADMLVVGQQRRG